MHAEGSAGILTGMRVVKTIRRKTVWRPRRIVRRWLAGGMAIAVSGGLVMLPLSPKGTEAQRLHAVALAHKAPQAPRAPQEVHPATAPPPVGPGYWLAGADGGIFSFGSSGFFGSNGAGKGPHTTVSAAAAPDGDGYWLASSDGSVTAFGSARVCGRAPRSKLASPVVAIVPVPHGDGYWLVTAGGRVLPFGAAHAYPRGRGGPIDGTVVGMASTPDGTGYWLVTERGQVKAFGDARLYGSLTVRARRRSVAPGVGPAVVGIAATADGGGYWLATVSGGVYSFGDAPSFGSGRLPARALRGAKVTGIAATADGRGYWLATADGRVYGFGDAALEGSMARKHLNGRVVAIVANPAALPTSGLRVLTTKLAPASASEPYRQVLQASGGLPPYSWTVASGQLPAGLVLDGASGAIEGIAHAPAVAPLVVRVEDRLGALATAQLTLVAGIRPVPLRPGKGALAVSVDQLPPGVPAAVTVEGPKGYRRLVTETTELVVRPGIYTVSAAKVDDGTDSFYPGVTGSPATVVAGRTAVVGVSYLTEVADTTKVVGTSQLSDLQSISGESLVFSPPPPGLAGVQAGDVVVAGPSAAAPGGFLRKVTGVSEVGGQLVLATTSATLGEAVPRGSFSVDWPTTSVGSQEVRDLPPAPVVTGVRVPTARGPGVSRASAWYPPSGRRRAAVEPAAGQPQPAAATTTTQYGGPCSSSIPCQFTVSKQGSPVACGYAPVIGGTTTTTTTVPSNYPTPGNPLQPFSLTITPHFSITPHLDASWSFPTNVQADAYVEVSEGVTVNAVVQPNVLCQYTDHLWGPQTFGIPDLNFNIGPVPVNISFLMEIDATLKLQSTSLITATETQGFTLQEGVSYNSQANPNFQPINNFQPANSFNPPTGSGYVKVSVGPKFTFAFYCYDLCYGSAPATVMVGPQIGLDGFVKVDLQSSHPIWDVGVGLEASIGFTLSIFKLVVLSAQFTIPIFTAYLASEPPHITSTPALPTDETGNLASPYTTYLSAAGFTKQPSYAGPPPPNPPKVPLKWALGDCQTDVADDTNGLIPGVKEGLVGLASDGTVTLPPLPAGDAGITISFSAQVTDSLGQCSSRSFQVPVVAGPHNETYPLANPEIGVPYVNFLQLAMLGLYNPPQGGTPPYVCPEPPATKRGYSQDPTYPNFAGGVGLYVSQESQDQTLNSAGNAVGPDCTIRGTVPATVSPALVASGEDQPLYVVDALKGTAWDTLALGPVAEPLKFCDYDPANGTCPEWPLQSPGNQVAAEVGAPFSAYIKAAFGVPLSQGAGQTGAYAYGLGYSCGQSGYATPPGLSISDDGEISGTPAQAGYYEFPVYAVDDAGACAWTWAYLDVAVGVATLPASLAPAEVGVAYQGNALRASGGVAPYAWQVTAVTTANGTPYTEKTPTGSTQTSSAVPLPGGLSVDSATGEITGTPGAGDGTGQGAPQPGTAGSYQVTFTVTDRLGATASETLPFVIAPPIAITSPVQLPPSTKGVAYSEGLSTSGGTGANAWSIIKGALPDGLALSSAGLISGTPAADATTAVISVKVTDSVGGSAVAVLVLPVGVAITTVSLPEAEQGVAYSRALQAAGGRPGYSWELATGSGPLPRGVSLAASGLLAGTPAPGSAGSYAIAVQVADASGGIWTSQFTLEVAAPPAVQPGLPAADLGAGYSAAATVLGGVGPFTWKVVPGDGQLPPGLSLDGTGAGTGTPGLVYGKPSELGSYGFQLEVTDSLGVSAEGPEAISVVSGPVVTTTYLRDGAVGAPYSSTLVAAGGVTTASQPYRWYLGANSSLPSGLTLSPNGTISGTPAAISAGTTSSIAVTVVDSWGASASALLTLRVDEPLGLNALAFPEAEVGLPYWAQFQAEGGYAPYSWQAVGEPPAGLEVSGGSIVAGTPTQAGYDAGFMLCATDSTGTPGCTSPGLEVAPRLQVATTALPLEPAGEEFSLSLGASGGVLGTVGYDWSLPSAAGATGYPLPPWLTLTGSGTLEGQAPPDAAGQVFQVPVQVSDALGAFATATVPLAIAAAPAPSSAPTTVPGAPTSTTGAATSTTAALPELTMATVSASPTSAQAGQSVEVSWTVDNTGAAPASGNWQDSVYLGSTPGATTTPLQIFAEPSSSPVAVGGKYSDTQPVTIPAGTAAGSYYLTVVADSNGALTVSSSANAAGSAAITVTAAASQPTLRAVASVLGNADAIAVGDGGTVLTYNGSSWAAASSGTVEALYGVAYGGTGSSDAWAVGAHGTILHTTDNGSSWSVESSGTTEDLYAISCAATSICWAVGAAGTVLATSDGANWSAQSSGTLQPLYGISCSSSSDCWAVGAGGTVVATANGGTTWAAQASGTTEALYGVSCPSATGCWAVGEAGTIVSTYGGSGWGAEASGTTANLYAVDVGGYCGLAPFGYCAYAVGAGGKILYYYGLGSNPGWYLASSSTTADLYGFSYIGPYFTTYAAVGSGETKLTGTPLGA